MCKVPILLQLFCFGSFLSGGTRSLNAPDGLRNVKDKVIFSLPEHPGSASISHLQSRESAVKHATTTKIAIFGCVPTTGCVALGSSCALLNCVTGLRHQA